MTMMMMILETAVMATNCNSTPPDVTPIFPGFNYKADNASAHKSNDFATSAELQYPRAN